jgi:hydroxymethylbilane synthase
MVKRSLIIATRESPLALWQANWVKAQLEQAHSGLDVQLLGLTTQADRMPYVSLAEIGGKGLFVKELEEALLEGRADIAVHSMKDMPMELPLGLSVPVLCAREEPGDVLVANQFAKLDDLPAGALVGTSSLRRQSLLLALRPDLRVSGLRGNVNSRLKRLDNNEYAAIILAAAGLKRLGLEHRITQYLSTDQFLPAVGQGVLGLECRQDDLITQALIAPLQHPVTWTCVIAERAMCRRLGGGCQVPVASYADIQSGQMILRGLVGRVDGSEVVRAQAASIFPCSDARAEQLGQKVAEDLIDQGAEDILRSLASKI